MMNGRERSDPAIVAAEPTNKTGQLGAELVEPRAGTEGNADQQSTCRAQNRESVSQALDRVRTAARHRKKERFTTLFHHLSVDLFREAFLALKRDAAPGVDGLTWPDYEADLERNLTDLHDRVHRGTYRALPSRRRYIPKSDGRQRPLAVATESIKYRGVLGVGPCWCRQVGWSLSAIEPWEGPCEFRSSSGSSPMMTPCSART